MSKGWYGLISIKNAIGVSNLHRRVKRPLKKAGAGIKIDFDIGARGH